MLDLYRLRPGDIDSFLPREWAALARHAQARTQERAEMQQTMRLLRAFLEANLSGPA